MSASRTCVDRRSGNDSADQLVEHALKKAQEAQATLLAQESSSVDFENDQAQVRRSSQRTRDSRQSDPERQGWQSHTTDPRTLMEWWPAPLKPPTLAARPTSNCRVRRSCRKSTFSTKPCCRYQKTEMIHLGQEMLESSRSTTPRSWSGPPSIKTYRSEFANSNGTSYSDEHTDFNVGTGGSSHVGPTSCTQAMALVKKSAIDEEDCGPRHRVFPTGGEERANRLR